MNGQKFFLANEGHVVNIIPPIDVNGGKSSDVFSMENYSHASIIIQVGVSSAAPTITLEECDNFTPTTHTEIAFNYYSETTASGDTLGAKAAATSSGFAISANDNIMYVIEVEASELSDGYPNLRISVSDGSASVIMSAVAILSGSRYGNDQSATAIV